jgi:hypothetical protein
MPRGFVRVGRRHDVADAAFATIFESVGSSVPRLRIEAVPGVGGHLHMAHDCTEALSTDD